MTCLNNQPSADVLQVFLASKHDVQSSFLSFHANYLINFLSFRCSMHVTHNDMCYRTYRLRNTEGRVKRDLNNLVYIEYKKNNWNIRLPDKINVNCDGFYKDW